MIFTLALWTYGIMLYSREKSVKSVKKVLLNPGIVAVYIGVIIKVFNIKLPIALSSTITVMGDRLPLYL